MNIKCCPRCKKEFECNADSIFICQCSSVTLTPEERVLIAGEYSDCLCLNCLKEIKAGGLVQVPPDNYLSI